MRDIPDNLSRASKRAILFAFDLGLIPIALYFAFSLRFGTFWPDWIVKQSWLLFPILMGFGAFVIFALGLHRIKLSTFERSGILKTALCAGTIAIFAVGVSYALGLVGPRSIPLLFGSIYFLLSTIGHLLGQISVIALRNRPTKIKRVVIYGAGQSGIQLASAFAQNQHVKPIAFVDDNLAKKGTLIGSVPIFYSNELGDLIAENTVDQIILAIPSIGSARRSEIFNTLKKYEIEVMALPSFVELLDGQTLLDSLAPVSVEDLLGRDLVDLNLPEIENTYAKKVVMVTGGGGSIGSELCRQLISCKIDKLVIYEHSELALYEIEQELSKIAKPMGIDVVAILGCVTHSGLVKNTLKRFNVQIILHAAAYKHVPLVEQNELAGLNNNVIGTRNVAEAAIQQGCERFILVSTDKAVRPTNMMGCSKRMAELVVQDLATRSQTTLLSMVRFGNVLGSSGSVIPLFKSQIEMGGPITVTHKDVSRYFMTITEASKLVLMAGCFARGGDVFVLDMGKPVKIMDLAKSLIELSGLSLKDETNPKGDIEILVKGLRPGEKLYEELLIGDDMLTTPHDKILRAKETHLSEIEVAAMLKDVAQAFEKNDFVGARMLVAHWVDGYHEPAINRAASS